jgi:hypothetical protein
MTSRMREASRLISLRVVELLSNACDDGGRSRWPIKDDVMVCVAMTDPREESKVDQNIA